MRLCICLRILLTFAAFLHVLYRFCAQCAALRTYTDFAHVLRSLRTYTASVFTMFNVDSLKGSDPEGFVDLFFPRELLLINRPNSSGFRCWS